MAVNVTEVPEQIVEALAIIVTAGITAGLTNIVIKLEVTEAGVAQTAFEVIITLTTSPFAKVLVVYVGAFVPTLIAFTCH